MSFSLGNALQAHRPVMFLRLTISPKIGKTKYMDFIVLRFVDINEKPPLYSSGLNQRTIVNLLGVHRM